MKTIAIYNLKGGVGKTTLSVNLAWCAATRSARRTLLWDLDPQAAASYLIAGGKSAKDEAQSIFAKDVKADKLIRKSSIKGCDLLAADDSLRGLDRFFHDLDKKKRLAKLIESLTRQYDRVILDCPPGLTETSEQVLRAADLVIVPVVPSPLSTRAFDEVQRHLDRLSGKFAPLMPVHALVDRRRSLHKAAIERHPDWPCIPMASVVERMAEERRPVGEFAPRSPAVRAFRDVWTAVEKKLNN